MYYLSLEVIFKVKLKYGDDVDLVDQSQEVWIGLDVFNNDTRSTGHISRPTQVSVSESCFHSLNK